MSERGSDGSCHWCLGDEQYRHYHDREWGVPVTDDRKLFEMLTLEGAQAGLSWLTILRRREGYRSVFHNFHPAKVAAMSAETVAAALTDSRIIRHRGKIASTVHNAGCVLEIQAAEGSFAEWVWGIVGSKPRINHWADMASVPASTPESENLSRRLKQRGFRFVGPTTCYAWMQAVGMVNDHLTGCPRHRACSEKMAKLM